MQQVVDLQESKDFLELDVELISLSPDPLEAWRGEGGKYGIKTPMLTDKDNKAATAYGVMRWAMGDEPGHTFVLVDAEGKIAWLQDYGAPENGGLMYVEPDVIVEGISGPLS